MSDEVGWPDPGVTFDVQRGTSSFPRRSSMTGEKMSSPVLWASRIPENAKAARREKVPGGIRVHWRRIRVVPIRG